MAYLFNKELQNRGDMSGFLTRPVKRTKPVLGDLISMDRNRIYFIFTGVFMDKGRPYTHMQRRQEDPAPNADPNIVDMTTPHPITADIYYTTCAHIDRNNRCHKESHDI